MFRSVLVAFGFAIAAALGAADDARVVSFVSDAMPGRAASHGLEKLREALRGQGWAVRASSPDSATGRLIVVAGTTGGGGAAARLLREAGGEPPSAAEALAVKRMSWQGRPALVLCGADDRGLMYAALDAADRVGWATDPADPLAAVRDASERPFVRERSLSVYTMNRLYWERRFYDDQYWTSYFDMLAADRFNRFLLVFGHENGGFLAPPYPYFFDTIGFSGVRMGDVGAEQQRQNLAALNRLIDLAHDRGIAVSVGIWDHVYRGGVQAGGAEWVGDYGDRPVPGAVSGLTTANLGAYTLAALDEFLAAVPGLDALQFRLGESSGLARGEIDAFWRPVFALVQRRRPGLPVAVLAEEATDRVLDDARALGVDLRVDTNYWMEQMGFPFEPLQAVSGERLAGGDSARRNASRLPLGWRLGTSGTVRVLLWADPGYVRRFSASETLRENPVWDVAEPLATKMAGQPPAQQPFDLMPERSRCYRYEFERYWHFFQVWGRLGYDPDTPSEVWRHEFERRFGAAAAQMEAGLHRASQVLPRLVAAIQPAGAASATAGWAERQPLGATLADYAANVGTAGACFESFAEAADRILAGGVAVRRTPEATSRWLDEAADAVLASAAQAEQAVGTRRDNEFDATLGDLRMLANLARFHARRSVAAVHYLLYEKTGELHEFDDALAGERAAVAAWQALVQAAGERYAGDLAMGARNRDLCGHWRNDLVTLGQGVTALDLRRRAMDPARVPVGGLAHVPVRQALPDRELALRATASAGSKVRVGWSAASAGERHWLAMEELAPGEFRAAIPAAAVRPGLGYRIEVRSSDGATVHLPREGADDFRPTISDDTAPPVVEHIPVRNMRTGQPLRIVARVTDPSGVLTVRLRCRTSAPSGGDTVLPMQPTSEPGAFAAVVPAEVQPAEGGRLTYTIEAVDRAGNGVVFPDPSQATPCTVVRLAPSS